MAKFKNDKGLTLIELLITIAVLAVVSAIALPVINNVVSASNSNALNQTIKDANDFINKYSKSGVVAYDALTRTFSGYVDTDGDNVIDSNELVDTLTLDAKYSATANGTSPSVGGSYSNGGVTGATVTASTGASTTGGPTFVGTSLNAQRGPGSLEVIGEGWSQTWYDYLPTDATQLSNSDVSYDPTTRVVTWTTAYLTGGSASNVHVNVWDSNGDGFAWFQFSGAKPNVTLVDNLNGTVTVSVDIDGLNPAWTSPVGLTFTALYGMGPGGYIHVPFTFN